MFINKTRNNNEHRSVKPYGYTLLLAMLGGILQFSSFLHCSSPGWLSSGSGSFNILAFAGLFAVATTVGGVLLTDAVDVGEVGVKEGMSNANAQLQQLTSSPSGGDSKLLLEVVLGLFGVTATGVGKHIRRIWF